MLRHGWRVAVSVAIVGASVSQVLATGSRPRLAVASTRPSPLGAFALVRSPGGVNLRLEIRSVRTGARLTDLGLLGSSWTNNGFAFSPDGRFVYLTLTSPKTLQVERVSRATGQRSIIANGEQPAVSFDGRELAFAQGPFGSTVLVVRDLASGHQRRVDLRSQLGRSYELLNSSIAWTRDASTVVVLAAHVAIADAARLRPRAADATPGRSCSTRPAMLCLIEIRVTPGRPLHATRRTLPVGNRDVLGLSTDGSQPRAVLMTSAFQFGSALDRITLTGSAPRTTPVVSLRRGLLVGVDPNGSRALYLSGSDKPALWRGQISHGRLVAPRELIPDVWLQAASW